MGAFLLLVDGLFDCILYQGTVSGIQGERGCFAFASVLFHRNTGLPLIGAALPTESLALTGTPPSVCCVPALAFLKTVRFKVSHFMVLSDRGCQDPLWLLDFC